MAELDAIQKELEAFGLSGKQAEIYLLLVTRGELRIQEIVTLSHMPRSSVYESLRHLYKLGLADEVISDSFKKVTACPIGVLRHDLEETVASARQQVEELTQLENRLGELAPDATGITAVRYYKGRAGARQMYWNTLKTNNTVYVYSEWGRQQYVGLQYYMNFAAENRKRHLTEQVLINPSIETFEAIRHYTLPNAPGTRTKVEDIRILDTNSVRIKGDTMIYNNIYAQVYLRNIEIHGFEIESQDFVETQRSIFETLWRTAKPVTDFL